MGTRNVDHTHTCAHPRSRDARAHTCATSSCANVTEADRVHVATRRRGEGGLSIPLHYRTVRGSERAAPPLPRSVFAAAKRRVPFAVTLAMLAGCMIHVCARMRISLLRLLRGTRGLRCLRRARNDPDERTSLGATLPSVRPGVEDDRGHLLLLFRAGSKY
jgi:hypothetical protein